MHEGAGDIRVGGVLVFGPECSGGRFLIVGERQLSALDTGTVCHNTSCNLKHTVTKLKPRDGYTENSGLL